MATIRIDEADVLNSARAIPLSHTMDGSDIPSFDYNEAGEAQDFGLDLEPEDIEEEEYNASSALIGVSPSEFAETIIRVPEAGRVSDFSFEGREYLRQIYDTPADKVLLQCGRQIEKCCHVASKISMEDGSVKKLEDIVLGDRVIGLALDKSHTDVGTVIWKSEKITKFCVKIKTRQGHVTIVALSHPMRGWNNWSLTGSLSEQEHLAVVRKAGWFTATTNFSDREVILAAYMVAEGYMPEENICTFTQKEGPVLQEFLSLVEGDDYSTNERKPGLWHIRFNAKSQVLALIKKIGIWAELSANKHVPDFVWGLDQRQTALFINRLWAGDGHASLQESCYHLEYDSISELLIKDVQRLLWKFGIPSSTHRWKPTLYKNTDKWAYKLRIETQDGAIRFIQDIGALGKTEDIPIIDVDTNSNRDVYPIGIVEDISTIHRSRSGYQRRGQYVPQPSLRSAGLREKPRFLLSRDKLRQYVDFFRSDDRFDQVKTEQLARHLDTDLYWDEIVSIEEVGEQDCYDITVEGTDSFVADGFITHNSTTLGNRLLCYAALISNFRSIYVAPSAEQAKVFSNDRIKDVIDASPMLRSYTSSKINQAVFFKKFINYSQIRLRYAYLTADRVRGIPADMVLIDELQDILVDNIPVIEQCAFHSSYKIFLYSGTPKSVDNTIAHYWSDFSTQNEWIVPCERHGLPNDSSTWHWNILTERNIGSVGLICDKCGETISAKHPLAQWASMNPMTEDNRDKVTFEGYRIPQIMVPWVDWEEITIAQEQYSRSQFMNEKLGMSYDSGVRPITRAQIQAICRPELEMGDIEQFKRLSQGRAIYAGIDWGAGANSSYTHISFGGYLGSGNFTIFWCHRFTGQDVDPENQMELITQMLSQLQVRIIGVDYGGGFYPNDKLIKRFGAHKVMKYQYNPRQKKKIYWEPNLKRWMTHRTEIMSDLFNAMKAKKIDLPRWEDYKEPHASDVLNIFIEYNDRLRINEYKKPPGKTDDAFHSHLLCLLASCLEHPRPDIFTPMQDTGLVENYDG